MGLFTADLPAEVLKFQEEQLRVNEKQIEINQAQIQCNNTQIEQTNQNNKLFALLTRRLDLLTEEVRILKSRKSETQQAKAKFCDLI